MGKKLVTVVFYNFMYNDKTRYIQIIKPISIPNTENNACYDIHTLFLIFPV